MVPRGFSHLGPRGLAGPSALFLLPLLPPGMPLPLLPLTPPAGRGDRVTAAGLPQEPAPLEVHRHDPGAVALERPLRGAVRQEPASFGHQRQEAPATAPGALRWGPRQRPDIPLPVAQASLGRLPALLFPPRAAVAAELDRSGGEPAPARPRRPPQA